MLEPRTLYVCGVPIGNLADASPRLREVLGSVDVVACEDTRSTAKLLQLLGIEHRPRLLSHHQHNEEASAAGILGLLEAGDTVALVSDAGTPAVSDPGAVLVDAALDAGFDVVAVAGPSAVACAVSVAGMVGDGYRFVGFLPRAEAELHALVERHAHEVLVGFESPKRIDRTLAAIAAVQGERRVAICRELTKLHEQVLRGTAAELSAQVEQDAVRGEIVLVLEALPGEVVAGADPRALALVRDLVEHGVRAKDATKLAADHVGGSARVLYDALHEDD